MHSNYNFSNQKEKNLQNFIVAGEKQFIIYLSLKRQAGKVGMESFVLP